MNIQIPFPILQQLPELWGPDALDFIRKDLSMECLGLAGFLRLICRLELVLAFVLGNTWPWQNWRWMILSLILSKFSFSLSPTYQHCPAFRLVIEPEHGVSLHIRRLWTSFFFFYLILLFSFEEVYCHRWSLSHRECRLVTLPHCCNLDVLFHFLTFTNLLCIYLLLAALRMGF